MHELLGMMASADWDPGLAASAAAASSESETGASDCSASSTMEDEPQSRAGSSSHTHSSSARNSPRSSGADANLPRCRGVNRGLSTEVDTQLRRRCCVARCGSTRSAGAAAAALRGHRALCAALGCRRGPSGRCNVAAGAWCGRWQLQRSRINCAACRRRQWPRSGASFAAGASRLRSGRPERRRRNSRADRSASRAPAQRTVTAACFRASGKARRHAGHACCSPSRTSRQCGAPSCTGWQQRGTTGSA
jgi:hypothetical protein